MITHIGSVPVFVSDLNRALAFYRDQLGFKVIMDVPYGGTDSDDKFRWIAVTPQKGKTELILFLPEMCMDAEQVEDAKKTCWYLDRNCLHHRGYSDHLYKPMPTRS